MTRELVTVTCGNLQLILAEDPTQQKLILYDKAKDAARLVVPFPKAEWDDSSIVRVLYQLIEKSADVPEIVTVAEWMRRIIQFRGDECVRLTTMPIAEAQDAMVHEEEGN